jgi:peptide/nickel transport system substrate-binding protein
MMRRRTLLGLGCAIGVQCVAGESPAMGRYPVGGSLSLQVPHDTSQVDPHDLSDPMAAIVGSALFETVFRLDSSGTPYPSLAQSPPTLDGVNVRVTLREGLRTSRGRALDARDLVASVERARSRGASALLSNVARPVVARGKPRVAVFRDVDPVELARLLASPLLAVVSRSSTSAAPDGTGPFRAEPSPDRLVLTRNRYAARGPAFLDQVTLIRASELTGPLRAFEARQVDVGWLGAGYYQQRSDAVPFDFGSVAWVVLRTGSEAGAWGGPGVAQRLLDGIEPSRLARLVLGSYPAQAAPISWGGGPCEILAPARSPHLAETARTLASILSAPGHEITPRVLPDAEIDRRRRSGAFALMVDLVRPIGPPGVATLLALATADDPARATSIIRTPPRLTSFAPRVLARTLRLGVVGDLRVAGAAIESVRLQPQPDGMGWDLGASYRLSA